MQTRYEHFLDCAAYLHVARHENLGRRHDTVIQWIDEQISQGPITDLVMTGGVGEMICFRSPRGFNFDVYPSCRSGDVCSVVFAFLSRIEEVVVISDGEISQWLKKEVAGPF